MNEVNDTFCCDSRANISHTHRINLWSFSNDSAPTAVISTSRKGPQYNGCARIRRIYLAHELRTKQQFILFLCSVFWVCMSVRVVPYLTREHIWFDGTVRSVYLQNQSYYISYSSSHACTHRLQSMHEFPVGRKKNRIEFSCFIASTLTRTVP